MTTGPLAGVRVIDLTTIYSGPICASILGDQGADVIKIESAAGDPMRMNAPIKNGMSGSFAMLNRNKRSMVLDIRTDAGRELLLQLIDDADLLLENFRPGVLDRLKVGYDVLRKRNPKLIFASINGVGATGPYAKRRVYDAVIQAVSGIADLATDVHGEPGMVNTLIADKLTAMTTAQSITAALYARSVSGVGQRLEVSMLDSALFFLWPDSMTPYTMLDDDVPESRALNMSSMLRKTADGYVAVMPVKAAEWEGCFRALGLAHLSDDERFKDMQGRRKNYRELNGLLTAAYAERTSDVLCEQLEAQDVPYARINTRAEAVVDPQVVAMGALPEVDHPQAGKLRQPRPPGQFADTPSQLHRPAPMLGQHTAEVLAELGCKPEEISSLIEQDVINSDALGAPNVLDANSEPA